MIFKTLIYERSEHYYKIRMNMGFMVIFLSSIIEESLSKAISCNHENFGIDENICLVLIDSFQDVDLNGSMILRILFEKF